MLKSRILIGKKQYIIPSVRFEEIEQEEELLNASASLGDTDTETDGGGTTGGGGRPTRPEKNAKQATFIFEEDFITSEYTPWE